MFLLERTNFIFIRGKIMPVKPRKQGMNWIRKEKRLALYHRDNLSCWYCGCHVSSCVLTLDHIKPYSKGGTNLHNNLVTSCRSCNSERGNKPFQTFALSKGKTMSEIRKLKRSIKKPLDRYTVIICKNLVDSLSWEDAVISPIHI